MRDPGRPATDLYDLVPLDVNRPYDVRDVIACLIDGEDFLFAFAFMRDQVYFTNLRILVKDKQGIFNLDP